jgi:hypothetical protein
MVDITVFQGGDDGRGFRNMSKIPRIFWPEAGIFVRLRPLGVAIPIRAIGKIPVFYLDFLFARIIL